MLLIPKRAGILANRNWDDKPRWSPDGRTIYFLSGRGGFFNVWGIHFDPDAGEPVGQPFQVSKFESPRLMVPRWMQDSLQVHQDLANGFKECVDVHTS
jgi:WD40 repeat protein